MKTESLRSKTQEIQVWWHGVAALPADQQHHAYHTLRRVWGDHTFSASRGFYRIGSEEHITSALFQNWALFPDTSWVASLVHAAGGTVGLVTRVRWAYECNERLDARLRPFHGRDFIIPDIMLLYEDEDGPGLLAFEVKKPGKGTEATDARKLTSYIDLPSTRQIARRYGCFLVGEQMAERSRQACNGNYAVLTWERLCELQMKAAREMHLPAAIADRIARWIGHHFAHYGVRSETASAPAPAGAAYAIEKAYRKIDALDVPDSVRRFLKGSECVEAVRNGRQPDPVFPWLADEPTAERIRERGRQKRGWQTNDDRMVCRWGFNWDQSKERTWR